MLHLLIVTCSMSSGRAQIADDVILKINSLSNQINVQYKIHIIDNGSKIKSQFLLNHSDYEVIEISENIGYWNALNWFFNHYWENEKFDKSDYVYIIESDNLHFRLYPLNQVIEFMNKFDYINSVRVEEFSVKYRWFYYKENRFLPFKKTRSLVSNKNLITKQKNKFTEMENNIYITNMHAKLTSISRLLVIQKVFKKLEKLSVISEKDFFQYMHDVNPSTAILNKGIFYTLSTRKNSKKIESGSYLSNLKYQESNYKLTRNEVINNNYHNIDVQINGKKYYASNMD
jgi:hypothetical protein